jgi:hypothetical protein
VEHHLHESVVMPFTRNHTVGILALLLAVASSVPAEAQRAATPRADGLQGNDLVIVATDHAFEAPEQVDAGLVNIRLFNRGKEMHHVLLIRVDRLDRIPLIADYLRKNDWSVPWMHPVGGPESVGPGGVATASLVLEPGRYVLACVVASPATHRLHFMDGMIRELSVVKGPTSSPRAELPKADVTLQLFEWNFNLSGQLFAGRRTIRVDNIGKFEHHVWIVRLNEGKTTADATRWAEDPKGPPPFEPVGGTTGLGPGRSINVTVDLLPGDYALLCTLFNPLSRKTHSAHGMIKPIRVVH